MLRSQADSSSFRLNKSSDQLRPQSVLCFRDNQQLMTNTSLRRLEVVSETAVATKHPSAAESLTLYGSHLKAMGTSDVYNRAQFNTGQNKKIKLTNHLILRFGL